MGDRLGVKCFGIVEWRHLPTKGDAEGVGVLRHDELRHVCQRGRGSDRPLYPGACLCCLQSGTSHLKLVLQLSALLPVAISPSA